MIETRRVSEWKASLTTVTESKVEEFKLLGYSRANAEEIWDCLEKKVWKGDPEKKLHEVVADIFHLSSSIYMTYLTMEAYQDDDLLASIAAISQGGESG
ncbi:post-transcriptional regulator [Sediminibacillus massiliensis]|uniref:post-transcriptional regulator n=1 Tax=Sediminibacillus massiliensis TaxID=1926277 RepID=UPI0009886E4E|nr:post-transcriptional regulator [Sediminibacillus massiliensis]